jgi:MerR family mercuric resistance operon transcriptional regulator
MVQSQSRPFGLTIAKLAASAGVGVETIRYYQRRGLLFEPPRTDAIRRYGARDVRRLQFIRQAQAAGFTLEEIKELLALDSTDDRARARTLAVERVKALDEQIRKLRTARDALKKLAKECAGGERGPCPILSAFDV